MKVVYTNTPYNKQKNPYPSFKAITLMSCVIALMVAIKVFYAPEESIEDVAAMANTTVTQSTDTTEETEDRIQTGTVYFGQNHSAKTTKDN